MWAFLERAGALRLTAVAKGDPDATTARISDAFGEARVSIVDVHFFAGVITVLTFEAGAAHLPLLEAGLTRAGVALDASSRAALAHAAMTPGDVEGTLSVTFAHGDPDRKHEIPSVPG